jgi:hypothetical protein
MAIRLMKQLCILFFTLLSVQSPAQPVRGNAVAASEQDVTSPFIERIQLELNDHFFVTGETLLFKVICLNNESDSLSTLSKIAYVELIDENKNPYFQTKVLMRGGTGAGDFYLPAAMPTGNYTLIAYTKWMKNFPGNGFFRSQISVVNPYVKNESGAGKIKTIVFKFYPEGGNLAAGVQNRVALTAVDAQNKPFSFKGRIVDQSGADVVEFSSLTKGFGVFSFIPVRNNTYKAIITDSTKNIFFSELPLPTASTIALQANESAESFDFEISGSQSDDKAKLFLQVTPSGKEKAVLHLSLINGKAILKLEKAKLPSGIFRVNLITEKNELLATRLLSNQVSRKVSFALDMDKTVFNPREKVVVVLKNSENHGPVNASVNVRLAQEKLPAENRGDSWMEPVMKKYPSMANALLIANSSEYKLPSDSVQFLPDLRGELISGKVVEKASGLPFANGVIYLSSPGLNYEFQAAKTDSHGDFFFTITHANSDAGLILQVGAGNPFDYDIRVDKEFLRKYDEYAPGSFEIDTTFIPAIKRKNVFTQIENAYYAVKNDSLSGIAHQRFYGTANKVYKLDDFTRFPTMEDVFREYILEVVVRKRDNKFSLQMLDIETGRRLNDAPLMLLDGVPVFDTDAIMSYNPFFIKQIQVVTKHYFFNPIQMDGIISFETYKGNAREFNFPYVSRLPYQGMQAQKIYYQPQYGDAAAGLLRIPDYRMQLCWQPEVVVKANSSQSLEFYTSDVPGDFVVELTGTTVDGRTIHEQKHIRVKSQ